MQNTTALPKKATAYHGHIYLVEFSDGTVKGGRTTRPRARVGNHRDTGAKFGLAIVNLWVSPEHVEFVQNELALLGQMRSAATSVAGSEYFTGVSFADSVGFASALPRSTLSAEEVANRQRRAHEKVRATFGDPHLLSTNPVPPILQSLFADPGQVFAEPVSREVEDRDALIAHIERLAELSDDDVNHIMDSNYVDMLGRICRTMIETRIIQLSNWAIENGRNDLLATHREVLSA